MRFVLPILILCLLTLFVAGCLRPNTTEPARVEVAEATFTRYEITHDVWCGPAPQRDSDFDDLERAGVRSILSVDGATPDVARARARSIGTVHIPVGYAGFTDLEMAHLAKALRELPRPIYVHCHLGRHRGPAAAAVGLIALAELTPEAGLTFLHRAGTSEAYSGLYQAVREASPLSRERITAAGPLVETATTTGLVATMAVIGQRREHLEWLEQSDWNPLEDHPDLVAVAEAGLLRDAFRQLLVDPDESERTSEYRQLMREAEQVAHQLEVALNDRDGGAATEHLRHLRALCTQCHRAWRN